MVYKDLNQELISINMNEIIFYKTSKIPSIVFLIISFLLLPLDIYFAVLSFENIQFLYWLFLIGILSLLFILISIRLFKEKQMLSYYKNNTINFVNFSYEITKKDEEQENSQIYLFENKTKISIQKKDILNIKVANAPSNSMLTGILFGAFSVLLRNNRNSFKDNIEIITKSATIKIYIIGTIGEQIKNSLNFNEDISKIEPIKNLDELN